MQAMVSFALSGIEVQKQLTSARLDEWMHNEVFHLRWWFLLVLFIVSIYLWVKIADKSRLYEIILYMALITISVLVLDELGEELTLWDYPYDLLPLFPPLFSVDLASLPIVYSLVYQYFRTWRSFIIASIVMAAIFCFILETLLVLTGVYQMLKWKSYYGFPIYIFMAIGAKALVNIIYSIHTKAKIINKLKTGR
jgi:hypothetical protein